MHPRVRVRVRVRVRGRRIKRLRAQTLLSERMRIYIYMMAYRLLLCTIWTPSRAGLTDHYGPGCLRMAVVDATMDATNFVQDAKGTHTHIIVFHSPECANERGGRGPKSDLEGKVILAHLLKTEDHIYRPSRPRR